MLNEEIKKVYRTVSGTFLFSALSREQTACVLSGDARLLRCGAGEEILCPGSNTPALYIIISGTAVVSKPQATRDVFIKTLRRGDVFGAATLFGGDEGFITSVRAKTDLSVVRLSQQAVCEMIRSYPDAALAYVTFLSSRIRFLNGKIDGYTSSGAAEGLMKYLLSLPCADGEVLLPMSCEKLAGALNISRATLYRAFDSLAESGALTRDGKRIRLLAGQRSEN